MAILQGFAKHRGRRGGLGRGGGMRQNFCCGYPPTPHIYIGARERGAGPLRSNLRRGRRPRGVALPPKARGRPPLGFPPQGVWQPQTHLGWRPRGERGGRTTRWALGPSEPRVSPLSLLSSPWALVGGCTSPPGASPLPHLAHAPSGAGGPTWWTPGTLPVVPVRYR